METIQVFRDDFDSTENHSPERSKLLGTFIEKEGKTAHGNASIFISNIEPIRVYLGYDGNVYPKFRLIKKLTENLNSGGGK